MHSAKPGIAKTVNGKKRGRPVVTCCWILSFISELALHRLQFFNLPFEAVDGQLQVLVLFGKTGYLFFQLRDPAGL
jgi:hypothetical protein